jgi:hypothetical protein
MHYNEYKNILIETDLIQYHQVEGGVNNMILYFNLIALTSGEQ